MKKTIGWLIVVVVCPAVAASAKKKQPLCSVREAAVVVVFQDAQGSRRNGTEVEVAAVAKTVQQLTWLKVVPYRPGVPVLLFVRAEGGSYGTTSPYSAKMGEDVVFAVFFKDEPNGVDWNAHIKDFQGTTGVGWGPYSYSTNVSTNDKGNLGFLLRRLNKDAHGCKLPADREQGH
jgi:hypothetical protein